MKYVLDRIGHAEYMKRVEALLAEPLLRLSMADCEPRPPVAKHGHVDFHAQKQPGKFYRGHHHTGGKNELCADARHRRHCAPLR